MISRTKEAPVAAASAMELMGSHNTFTPNGTLISERNAPIANAMVAVEASINLEFIRPVILVAEHHCINTCGLQRSQVLARAFNNPVQPCLRIMQGRSWQSAEMHHGDDWFCAAKNLLEFRCHSCFLSRAGKE